MQIEPCGDRAFSIRLGDVPHPALARRIALLRERLLDARIAGLEDAIPGFVTLLVLYDPDATSIAALAAIARSMLPLGEGGKRARLWTIPVCYDERLAPDLATVAAATGLEREEVVRLHTSGVYTVYLIGFSPGFPYMGDLDARLELPRRADPRAKVPAGSVAVATRYTAIYPHETAGGWHLIGRTPLRLFDPERSQPSLLSAGDGVRFSPIGLGEYETLRERVAAGSYVAQYTEVDA